MRLRRASISNDALADAIKSNLTDQSTIGQVIDVLEREKIYLSTAARRNCIKVLQTFLPEDTLGSAFGKIDALKKLQGAKVNHDSDRFFEFLTEALGITAIWETPNFKFPPDATASDLMTTLTWEHTRISTRCAKALAVNCDKDAKLTDIFPDADSLERLKGRNILGDNGVEYLKSYLEQHGVIAVSKEKETFPTPASATDRVKKKPRIAADKKGKELFARVSATDIVQDNITVSALCKILCELPSTRKLFGRENDAERHKEFKDMKKKLRDEWCGEDRPGSELLSMPEWKRQVVGISDRCRQVLQDFIASLNIELEHKGEILRF